MIEPRIFVWRRRANPKNYKIREYKQANGQRYFKALRRSTLRIWLPIIEDVWVRKFYTEEDCRRYIKYEYEMYVNNISDRVVEIKEHKI